MVQSRLCAAPLVSNFTNGALLIERGNKMKTKIKYYRLIHTDYIYIYEGQMLSNPYLHIFSLVESQSVILHALPMKAVEEVEKPKKAHLKLIKGGIK